MIPTNIPLVCENFDYEKREDLIEGLRSNLKILIEEEHASQRRLSAIVRAQCDVDLIEDIKDFEKRVQDIIEGEKSSLNIDKHDLMKAFENIVAKMHSK